MKKLIPILLVLCLILSITLVACGDKKNDTKEKTIYDTINDELSEFYENEYVSVKIKKDDLSVTSEFFIINSSTTMNVVYKINKLNEIEYKEGKYVVPETPYTKYEGNVSLQDGNVLTQNGDPVDFDFSKLDIKKVSFKESYFENVNYENDVFTANIKDVNGFLNIENSTYSSVGIVCSFKQDDFEILITGKTQNESDIELQICLFKNNPVG